MISLSLQTRRGELQLKKQKTAIAVVITITVISGMLVLLLIGPQSEAANLKWAVAEGDEINFSVMVYARNLANASHELDDSESIAIMNNTLIHVTIVELHDIPDFVNASIFLTEVIRRTNVSMAFTNGSKIPQVPLSYLTEVISSTILPVGNWQLIDDMFQNEAPSPPFAKSWYFSRVYEHYMAFGHTNYGPDFANGWMANVSLVTGLPMVAEYWSWDAVADFSYRLVMTAEELISTNC